MTKKEMEKVAQAAREYALQRLKPQASAFKLLTSTKNGSRKHLIANAK
jgi:hypothetical protein